MNSTLKEIDKFPCNITATTEIYIEGVESDSGGREMFATNDRSQGSWTGWLCDQDSMQTISRQMDPVGYLEQYPKNKASNLNTLFKGFAIYHHGEWFILDKKGSELAKQAIRRSPSSSGFMVTVQGSRKGDKIKVTAVFDKTPKAVQPTLDRFQQNRGIRNEFRMMGI
jgi:hypothetical protein